MDIRFQNTSGKGWQADCALVGVFEGEEAKDYAPSLWEKVSWLEITPALRDFKGKAGERLTVYGHPDNEVSRVTLIGLGKKDKVQVFRTSFASAVKECRDKGYDSIGLVFDNFKILAEKYKKSSEELAAEAVVAAKQSLYLCKKYKGLKKDEDEADAKDPSSLALFLNEKSTPDSVQKAVRKAEAEANGVLMARDIINGPANFITPTVVAEEAEKIAKDHSYKCTILSEDQAKDAGMGAFIAVAVGSEQEGKVIILEHCPKGKEKDDPFVVVGKGITFDTGGISLKPGLNMHEMKSDMAGAGAVLGFFEAMGQSPDKDDFPRTVGIILATENMPGGKATRPGDIVTTLSGQTVEILNTDAEGRLVLCDGLSYAQKHYKPKALINLATLTGACVVALGDYATGLFTDDSGLRRNIMDASEYLGELSWPLPMWDEYDESLKSDVADFANIGSRMGGALHAALFLRRFIDKDTRWAHLDIAGPGYVVKTNPLHPVAGATGMGVRLLCRLAKNFV